MTIRYRITARVTRDGEPFTTEPEFGPTVDDAKSRLRQWVEECGWAFLAWHDLFQIEEVPLGFGCVTHHATQISMEATE